MRKKAKKIETGTCRQVAALPWRLDADRKPEVLLITSRTNGKWMLPKGWPMAGRPPDQAALIEAQEEAGIVGEITPMPVGSYHYTKLFNDGSAQPAQALIYPLRVTSLRRKWKERGQRERRWCSLQEASKAVFEPDLSRFLADLSPERLAMFDRPGVAEEIDLPKRRSR